MGDIMHADAGRMNAPTAARSTWQRSWWSLTLTVHEFMLTGETTSTDNFCGAASGYAQVFGMSPSDRIRLEGSTFAGTRITGDTLPTPVSSCTGVDP